jgi:hypothetical protein
VPTMTGKVLDGMLLTLHDARARHQGRSSPRAQRPVRALRLQGSLAPRHGRQRLRAGRLARELPLAVRDHARLRRARRGVQRAQEGDSRPQEGSARAQGQAARGGDHPGRLPLRALRPREGRLGGLRTATRPTPATARAQRTGSA